MSNKPKLKDLDPEVGNKINELTEQLAETARQTQTIGHGLNVLNGEVGSPVDLMIYGETIVNIIVPSIGKNEIVSGWVASGGTRELDSANAKYGVNALKLTIGTGNSEVFAYRGISSLLQNGKYYILVADVKNGNSANGVDLEVNFVGDVGLKANTKRTISSYGTQFIKIQPTDFDGASVVNLIVRVAGVAGQYGYFDGFRLIEIDKATYDKIGVSLQDADIEKMFPYVDGVQHLSNPAVIAEGENLLPPFSEWTLQNASMASVEEPYKLTSKDVSVNKSPKIYAFPNTQYSLSVQTDSDRFVVFLYDKNGASLGNYNADTRNGKVNTFTTPANIGYMEVHAYSSKNGTWNFEKPMLNIGQPKPFVPRNPSYLFADIKHGAIGDKKDVLSKSDGKWLLTKNVEKDVALDGNLPWATTGGTTNGNRYLHVSGYYSSSYVKEILATDYKQNKLPTIGYYAPDADRAIRTDGSVLGINVPDAETGFLANQTLSADLIKAYFNGWKYKGDGTTHSWVSIVDGSAPPTNTLAYVSKNMAIGYTPYKLSYALAKHEIIDVSDKVEGDIVVNGLTQVEVTSGFTYTIDDKGKRIYTFIADKDRYKSTCNATEVKATYSKSFPSAMSDINTKLSDAVTDISINNRSIIDLYVRLKALEGS